MLLPVIPVTDVLLSVDSILFVFIQGGKTVLQIPAPLWTILVQNKRFEGIRPTPNPKPNPDGSYTVKLTTTQFKVFEENQKKPAIPVPAEPAKPAPGKEPEPEKPAPGKEPKESTPALEKKPDEKIKIEKDFRMSKHFYDRLSFSFVKVFALAALFNMPFRFLRFSIRRLCILPCYDTRMH